MPRKTDSAEPFLQRYPQESPVLQEAAQQAENLTRHLLRDLHSAIHQISSRAKDRESALWKIRRKGYSDPSRQLTDTIGVRVITYYESDVDRVVQKLANEFEIDPKRSVDKRRALDLRSFGYRSVHLIARLKGHRASSPEYAALTGRWFEIQVRSILEHAWAEIEHEVVYKSGIGYPLGIERRFAAIAGTLELIEKEFLALKEERDRLTDEYRKKYDLGLDGKIEIDSARLLALMESQWPHNPSWRAAERGDKPFPPHIECRCVDALKQAHLNTADSVRRIFRSDRFRRALRRLAASELIPSGQVSHLALTVLAIAVRSLTTLHRYFPEFINSVVTNAVKSRPRQRR
jgi:ppGpp synthetase/RelA/SpoT-type nucleotidyltranferase